MHSPRPLAAIAALLGLALAACSGQADPRSPSQRNDFVPNVTLTCTLRVTQDGINPQEEMQQISPAAPVASFSLRNVTVGFTDQSEPLAVASSVGDPGGNLFVSALSPTGLRDVVLTEGTTPNLYASLLFGDPSGCEVTCTTPPDMPPVPPPGLAAGEHVLCKVNRLDKDVAPVEEVLPDPTIGSTDLQGDGFYGLWGFTPGPDGQPGNFAVYMELSNPYYTRGAGASVTGAGWLRELVDVPADPASVPPQPGSTLDGTCVRTTDAPQTRVQLVQVHGRGGNPLATIDPLQGGSVPLDVPQLPPAQRLVVTANFEHPKSSDLDLYLLPPGRDWVRLPADQHVVAGQPSTPLRTFPPDLQGVAPAGRWWLYIRNRPDVTTGDPVVVRQFGLQLTYPF
jgi:hypothetical protein